MLDPPHTHHHPLSGSPMHSPPSSKVAGSGYTLLAPNKAESAKKKVSYLYMVDSIFFRVAFNALING